MKNDLESTATDGFPKQLIAVLKFLIPTHLEIREKTLHCLIESHTMSSKLILLKVVLEI